MQDNQNKLSIVDQDSTLRIYNLDLRHKVRGLWDEKKYTSYQPYGYRGSGSA